jgi:hypothetical protein
METAKPVEEIVAFLMKHPRVDHLFLHFSLNDFKGGKEAECSSVDE